MIHVGPIGTTQQSDTHLGGTRWLHTTDTLMCRYTHLGVEDHDALVEVMVLQH